MVRTLALLSAVVAIASGCVVSSRPYRPYAYSGTSYHYYGEHPLPGDEWCYLDYDHIHDFQPSTQYYSYSGSYYTYVGPTTVWYYDGHPDLHGGVCYLQGRHSHNYGLGRGYSNYRWDRSRGYVYNHDHNHNGYRPPPGQGTWESPPPGRPSGNWGRNDDRGNWNRGNDNRGVEWNRGNDNRGVEWNRGADNRGAPVRQPSTPTPPSPAPPSGRNPETSAPIAPSSPAPSGSPRRSGGFNSPKGAPVNLPPPPPGKGQSR
ncbi:MAG: hypothetical protein ACT4TC_17575 [Myxococcaceae bacterium]